MAGANAAENLWLLSDNVEHLLNKPRGDRLNDEFAYVVGLLCNTGAFGRPSKSWTSPHCLPKCVGQFISQTPKKQLRGG